MTEVFAHERVNIRYTQKRDNQAQAKELPLKILLLGDYKGNASRETDEPLSERQPHAIDHSTFNAVMAALDIGVTFSIRNDLNALDKESKPIQVHLKPRSLADFHPDSLLQQVPELHRLLMCRKLLTRLKQSPRKHEKIILALSTLFLSNANKPAHP